MIRGLRRFFAFGIIICAVGASAGIRGDNSSSAIAAGKPSVNPQVAARLMEVRLRRLHLVRPDLIPYPIAYELIC
jgi:hypothetical protein